VRVAGFDAGEDLYDFVHGAQRRLRTDLTESSAMRLPRHPCIVTKLLPII
jgi:hypothetical protein